MFEEVCWITLRTTHCNIIFCCLQDKDKEALSHLKEVTVDEIMEAQRAEQTAKEEQEKVKTKALLQRGLPVTESDTYLSHDDIFT